MSGPSLAELAAVSRASDALRAKIAEEAAAAAEMYAEAFPEAATHMTVPAAQVWP